MSEPRHIYSPTHHHQQELREAKVQHLASDPTGWGDAVPWYLTTINRIKVMAAGVARIIPFLANSGSPTSIGINRPGSRGSSGDAAAIDHEHGTPDIATESTSGWMGSSHVASINANSAHRNATGNPHSTQITDIPNLRAELDGKSNTGHGHGIPDITGLTSALADKAPLASPALTGTPTAPTASQGTNSTQIATTAYVRTAIADLVDTAPGTLDTLNEIAAALGDDPNFAATITNELAGKASTSHDHSHLNFGNPLHGAGDAFSAREDYDVRGGVCTGFGVGPFSPPGVMEWHNIVDIRHRNGGGDGVDSYGGQIAWQMFSGTPRIAFRSRPGTSWGSWVELSRVGHGHSISDVSGLQAILDNRLPRVPVNISNGNANSVLANGIYAGYSVANAPNPSWGVLRVYRAADDSGDQVWQTWTSASYATNQEFRRSSYDFGATWTPWMSNKELDGLGQMHNISWSSSVNVSWFRIGSIRAVNQYDSGIFSGIVVSGAGAANYSDNAAYMVTARLKQQNPMTSPIHIIELSWSQLTGLARYRFGYVVSTDSVSEKVISIYGQRLDGYTGTNCAILTKSGYIGFYPDDVTESEPAGIVYVDPSISAPVQKRAFLIGNGSATHFKLNHGLGTKNVNVVVRMTASPRSRVECIDDLDSDDPLNNIWVGFEGHVPGNNEFEVTVFG